jgi:hypothetical protein
LALGHGDIFELDIVRAVAVDRFGNAQQPPWMMAGADLSDFFNYNLDGESWRYYCAAIAAYKCDSANLLRDAVDLTACDQSV